jgi:hypothetical protein
MRLSLRHGDAISHPPVDSRDRKGSANPWCASPRFTPAYEWGRRLPQVRYPVTDDQTSAWNQSCRYESRSGDPRYGSYAPNLALHPRLGLVYRINSEIVSRRRSRNPSLSYRWIAPVLVVTTCRSARSERRSIPAMSAPTSREAIP